MKRNVGGYHVQDWTRGGVKDAWGRHPSTTIKLLNTSWTVPTDISLEGVDVVLREVTNDQLSGLEGSAVRCIEAASKLRGVRSVAIETGCNEAYQFMPDLRTFAESQIPAAQRIRDAGYTPVVFNWSVGNLAYIRGAVVNNVTVTREGSHLYQIQDYIHQLASLGSEIGYHNYDIPEKWHDPWLGERHVKMHDELLDLGIDTKWRLTESLIDHGIKSPERPLAGWRWQNSMTPTQAGQLWREKCQRASTLSWCNGVYAFGAGAYDDWSTFEYADTSEITQVFTERFDVGYELGAGYLKAQTYFGAKLGDPQGDEIWYLPNTPQMFSAARFTKAIATWCAEDNVTAVRFTTPREVWTDRGNRGNGRDFWLVGTY